MAPTLLEGATLGEIHKNYNKALKEELVKSLNSEKIDIEDIDINNLLKIDTANRNKNVEYIMEVLKSEDMLYVSRAIKRCTWLVTEPQYAHIVNPHYLYTQLFPHMTTKATNKLMLHIRLNLKDEDRVEDFYNHYKNKDKNTAFKWLLHCSLFFIEKEIENNNELIQLPVMKRLCERSFSFVEILIRNCVNYTRSIMSSTLFLLNTDAENYCDIVEKLEAYQIPDFGPKFTRLIMNKCPQRILDNFATYCSHINLKIFAKYLTKRGTNINVFLLRQFENKSMKVWFKYDNLKYFMPKEFEFLKKVLIEKPQKVDISIKPGNVENLCEIYSTADLFSAMLISSRYTNVYHWYRYAPFDVAFIDVKKMIRAESAPAERAAMLGVLVSCAGRNLQHMHSLLQYYHDKHINEPFQFKMQFINNLLLKTDTHRFTNETWNILNNIFCSMEVYTESVNNAQICFQSIVVYKVLHGLKIPEVVEKKFTFDTLKSQRKKLNEQEQVILFIYLLNNLVTEIQSKNIQNESEFMEVLQLLERVLDLLIDWKKELLDYPLVIDEIKKLVNIKRRAIWSVDLSALYNKKKSWRKHLFEYSLVLFPSQEVCINALKHDPKLLDSYRSEVEALCRNDDVSLDRLLSKLRIYWPESLAREWTDWYLGRLDSSGGHKALVRGLCALLPQKQLIDIIRKYAPTESKIMWNEKDNIQLNLRRQFAKKMYLARPPPSSDIVLLYARGDYLQFALPSLNALLSNLSPVNSCEQITKFLDAPVSLQKHGIRLAFSKLKYSDLKLIILDIWKSNKNSTIRAMLFTQTYSLLCKEKKSVIIKEIWKVLSMFIDSLGPDENKTICHTLCNVGNVPFVVRADFCMKSYKYLKSLPAKSEYEKLIAKVIHYTRNMMEFLDAEFVADILLGTLDKKYAERRYEYTSTLSSYLMSTKDAKVQIQRYETLLVPLLERSIDQWQHWQPDLAAGFFGKSTVDDILRQLCSDIQIYGLQKKMVIPVEMFKDIQSRLERKLSISRNYILLRSWKLVVTYIKLLNTQATEISNVTEGASDSQTGNNRCTELHIRIAPEFSETCTSYLKDDVKSYFASICVLFADALKNMFSFMNLTHSVVSFETLKYMLENKDFVESYIVVLINLPNNHYKSDPAIILEMRKIICLHASPEIKMHYYKKFCDCKL